MFSTYFLTPIDMTCVQVDQALHHHGDTSTQLSVGQADMSPMLDDVRLGELYAWFQTSPNIAHMSGLGHRGGGEL